MAVKNVIYQLLTKLYPTGKAWFGARNFIQYKVPEITNGLLYNWAATQLTGFAPEGWHLPTEAEVDSMIAFIGGSSVGGGKLKSKGLEFWNNGNNGTDNYGFSAYGSGVRISAGTFLSIKDSAYFYAGIPSNIRSYNLDYNSNAISHSANAGGTTGLSIRFIKDDSDNNGSLIDNDGNEYKTCRIGDQVWTSQNWACTTLIDGTPIPNLTVNLDWSSDTLGAYCAYDNDINNAIYYGDSNNDDKSAVTYSTRVQNYETVNGDVDKILNQLIPDNNLFNSSDATNWERQYGINNSNLTQSEREAIILTRRTYPNGVLYRQTGEFLQQQLRVNGFDVYVHENRFDTAGVFSPINPKPSIYGTIKYGEAVYGNVGIDYYTLLSNYVDQTIDSANEPAIFGREGYVFFIGDEVYPNKANIPSGRLDEFKHLILSLKPAHSMACLLINII